MTIHTIQNRTSEEEFRKSLEGFNFTNFKIEGDVLDTERLVNLIYTSFLKESTIYSVNGILAGDFSIEKLVELTKLFEKIIIKSRCADNMFNEPPREELDDNDASKEVIPSIVVYKDGALIWANKSYLRNIGINSLLKVKELASYNYEDGFEILGGVEVPILKNGLVEEIYKGNNKDKVYNRVKVLKNNSGYEGEFFKPTLPSGEENILMFSSHGINNGTGSVRIGKNIKSETEGMSDEEIEKHISDFYTIFDTFYTPDFGFAQDIMNLNNTFKKLFPNTKFDEGFYETLDNLFFRAEVTDLIFSKSPYAMNLYNGQELLLANKCYVDLAGKSFFEMQKLSKEGKLMSELFGDGVEAEFVRQSVDALEKHGHYYKQFSFVTTNKIADFDTFNVGFGHSFRIGDRDIVSEKFCRDYL